MQCSNPVQLKATKQRHITEYIYVYIELSRIV